MQTKEAPYGYKIDTRIRDRYHAGFLRKDSDVTYFIQHGTGGGNTAESTIKWMLDGGYMGDGVYRRDDYAQGEALFHYIIDRDGTIIEIINPHRWVYHSSAGKFDAHTIGAELVNPSHDNSGTYTDKQYKADAWLYCFLLERFPRMVNIYGHGQIKLLKTGQTKSCPGSGFDGMILSNEITKISGKKLQVVV